MAVGPNKFESGAGVDSDDEFEAEQRALALIKAGKAVKLNEEGNAKSRGLLLQKIEDLREQSYPAFKESLAVTTDAAVEVVDVNDDLNRELVFYSAALAGAAKAHRELHAQNIPFQRPKDYFAEMLKTDEHMQRVKRELLFEQQRMKAVDARKKAQHNRKYQKEIQDVRREERLKSKKAAVEAVKTWRSKEGRPNVGGTLDNERELFDIHLENTERDMKGKSADGKKRKRESGPRKQKSKKRQALDKKYGLGGRPRAKKRNSAESSSDMSGYFRHHNAGQGGKGKKNKFGHGRKGGKEAKGGKGARKRPGKNARRR